MQRFEQEKDVSYKSSKRRSRSLACLIIVSVLSFVLLVISIVFITLYALEKSKTTSVPRAQSPQQTYCGTKPCFDTARDAFKQLNQSADPCTDFYEYACGGWEDENTLEAGETSVTGFSLVREKSYNILKDALENAKKTYPDNEAVMKTVKFFNACNDTAAVEARGDDPMKKLIADMGGWSVTGNMKPLSSLNITQRIGRVSSELFIKPFIDVKVFIDPHDSNKHILQFGSGELGMVRSYYSKNSSEYQAVRDAYTTYMKKVAKYLGGGPDSDEQMMKVFEFETKLAKLENTPDESSIIETLKKELPAGVALFDLRTTLQQLSKASKMDLDKLVAFVNAVFARQGRKFKKDEKVLAYPPNYYTRIFNFYENITRTDPVVVVNYIIWTVINNFIRVLPQKYRDAKDEYVASIIGNRTRHRWKDCIDGMQQVLGMPLGLLFVDAAFDEGSKETITQMTRLIKDEFIKTVDTLPWMSDDTKVNAIEKANAIAEDIGYPSYIKNPSELASKIKGLKVEADKLLKL
ncbi:hypothetical protein OS493_030507 [Desmophyllum pertusum]|uniref:Peptidase M13 N-terminal domain-containing protein n=1 Tax=Desmophyllum pertusum TaxID=174260 RepID=A0A9X0CI30_9CNID|nr:hypothetical protein OS493_030507 [Desmophyllum pertusum]